MGVSQGLLGGWPIFGILSGFCGIFLGLCGMCQRLLVLRAVGGWPIFGILSGFCGIF